MNTATSRPLPRRTQAPCCYASAMENDATFCAECGSALVRCMAFEECGGLLDDNGLCTVCVDPQLQIDAGALTAAKVGAAVALPLSVTNASVVGRPLFVTGLYIREGGADWREEDLGWERLIAGETRPTSVRIDQLDRSGVHGVEIMITVASRWRWRQECYALTARMTLSVEDESAKGHVVNIGGESAGHGNTVYISGKRDGVAKRVSDQAFLLGLVRAEKEERRLGLRGVSDGVSVPRNTRIEWRGFPKTEVPSDGIILTMDGILGVGRSRTRQDGGLGDVRLLAEAKNGNVDKDISRMISRRHFEIYNECDRLILRVNAQSGLRINGEAYGPDKTVILNSSDTISPLVNTNSDINLQTTFRIEHGLVRAVTFARLPASQRGVT